MGEDVNAEFGLDILGRPVPLRPGVELMLTVSAAVDLSVLKLRLEKLRLPLALTLELPSTPGQAPRLQFDPPQLLGPDGASAELTLPGFSGGGYLVREGSQWSGALEVNLSFLSASAFGVLTTDQFSLLVVLAAEFPVPIQLSFGFTLIGIGGMVGINRRPDTDALIAAASSGDLGRMMFPKNAVADAPRMLPTLARCFPQSDGDFIVGPMLKLGWGTPTLISATIGVLVGTQGVILLGRLAVILPTEEADLIHLEAVVFGCIDADGLFLSASIVNSHIVGIRITGDVRFLLRWSGDALFAFSAGGFHPAFPPPERMGGMKRIGAELSPGDFLSVRIEAYFAVTSNSAQFGARFQLYAAVAGFEIEGGSTFDALIVLDPFGFMVDFEAHVSARVSGISVMSIRFGGHLSGPSPWRIRGSATIELPILPDIDINLPEITWGESAPPPLPPARDPLIVLTQEVARPSNWSAVSASVPNVVHLRPGVDANAAAIHPLGSLGFTQNAIPLQFRLQRVDGRSLPQPTTLTVESVGEEVGRPRPSSSQFAPSQFTDMQDQAKLSSSGYVTLDAGFEVTPATSRYGAGIQTRDVSEPETAVRGDSLRRYHVRSDVIGLEAHLLVGTHGVWEEPERVMNSPPLDPAVVTVNSRLGAARLADAVLTQVGAEVVAGLGGIDNVGAAEAILDSARLSGELSFDVVVARPWEMV